MSEDEATRDPNIIRAWFEQDWADQYVQVPRIPSPREMWIDVHADHQEQP